MGDINFDSVRKSHLPFATVILAFMNIAIMAVLFYRFNTIEPDPQSLVDVGGSRSREKGGDFVFEVVLQGAIRDVYGDGCARAFG